MNYRHCRENVTYNNKVATFILFIKVTGKRTVLEIRVLTYIIILCMLTCTVNDSTRTRVLLWLTDTLFSASA